MCAPVRPCIAAGALGPAAHADPFQSQVSFLPGQLPSAPPNNTSFCVDGR